MLWHIRQIFRQSIPPAPTWSADDIPNQTGRVHLVTGGGAGIGRETVKALLNKDAKVYLAARSSAKTDATIAALKEETGREAHFLELDLASLDSVQRAARMFLEKEPELHVLYNNAGLMFPDVTLLTADGYDLQFGTNVLGHFYFTQLLMPALQAGRARIVNLSSLTTLLFPTPITDFDVMHDGPLRQRSLRFGSTVPMYAISKLGNALYAKELHRRYAKDGIVAIAVNPGNIKTDLYRYVNKYAWQRFLLSLGLYPVSLGALTQLYAGTAPEAAAMSGQFLVPWARPGPLSRKADDVELAQRMWDWLQAQVERHERKAD